MSVDLLPYLTDRMPAAPSRVSSMAHKLVGSEILKIAQQIRELTRSGTKVLNLTVGDFAPEEFAVPAVLIEGVKQALDAGHTNYPPAAGVPELRAAVRKMTERRLGLSYPDEATLIAAGARPMIAGIYFALVNPGEKVVYPLPSWNNNHYCTMVGAERVEVPTTAASAFFPRLEDLAPHLADARLICINTPLNPTGTVMEASDLERLSRAIVAENVRRKAIGQRALYLMFDQVYWMLTFRGAQHATPLALVPEIAAYTVVVDAISKCFAATGLRVGWAFGPIDVINRMSAILTHIGAWAPRAEQIATAALLEDDEAMDRHLAAMREALLARLETLSNGLSQLRAEGLDVEAIAPAGAIYLSLRVGARGRRTPDGTLLSTDEQIRKYLLESAGVALIPFSAFGLEDRGEGWFRASIGAVSKDDCKAVVAAIGAALRKLG